MIVVHYYGYSYYYTVSQKVVHQTYGDNFVNS